MPRWLKAGSVKHNTSGEYCNNNIYFATNSAQDEITDKGNTTRKLLTVMQNFGESHKTILTSMKCEYDQNVH